MEHRLELHVTPTPASEPVVVPNLPIHHVDLDAEHDARHAIGFGAPALQSDRLLERLGPRRLAEIRTRLSSGAYNAPEVIGTLAMRMLESGDLR